MELVLNVNVKTKRKFLLRKCLLETAEIPAVWSTFFFAFIKNKNSITGKHAVFAIKGRKLEGKTPSY